MMKWLHFFWGSLLLLSLSSDAQDDSRISPAQYVTTIPFQMLTGGIVVVQARVGTHPHPLNFILDTGSGGISLDSATCDVLKMEPQPSNKTIRGIAGIRQVKFVYNLSLHFPRLTIDSLNFHVNDYDILTSTYGVKIDGIIGYAFLSRYIVKVNYDSSCLYVFRPGSIRYPKGGHLLRPLLVNIPVTGSTLFDQRLIDSRFFFDTGAGMCLLLSREFVNDSSVFDARKKWYPTQAEGLGGKTTMQLGILKRLKFGPYRFRQVPIYVFNDDYNVTSYPSLGGLIGNDLLRRFNLTINYPAREIHLMPNHFFKEPFDYSYTGLGIYLSEGQIRVEDVMVGSPGEEAGFRQGDVILAVDNDFSRNIQQYKNILQHAEGKVRILILRDDVPQLIRLRVKNIRRHG